MTILPSSLNNKIVEGIKQVGIGRKGSKSLTNELIAPIIEEIKSAKATPAQIGAFFAGLFLKGIEADELKLNAAFKKPCLHDASKLVENVVEEMVPPRIKAMAVSLLKGDVLCYSEALSLGRVLFSDLLCDGLRGLTASALRVRYETDDEYAGLLKAIEETREEVFEEDTPPGTPIIQIAEPFDGMDKGYLITPLLANYLVEKGFRVVCLTGKNAGPKDGVCLNHLVEKLDLEKIARPKDLTRQPRLGWYLSVEHYAPPLQRWVDLRRQIVKRPFLATLEKFLNPFDAKLCITSAFHGAYSQKNENRRRTCLVSGKSRSQKRPRRRLGVFYPSCDRDDPIL